MGGATHTCMPETEICADMYSPSMSMLSDGGKYLLGATTAYSTQGYYGLYLALNKDFTTSWGLGHSSALMALYVNLPVTYLFYERTYVHRLTEDKLERSVPNRRATLVWFANDVGFFGTLLLLIPLARIYALSWIDATEGGDDQAAVLFALLSIQVFYFTANSQLLQTLDGYLAILSSWLALWVLARSSKSRLLTRPPTSGRSVINEIGGAALLTLSL